MIHFEQVPFFVHLNPVSFGAWFARFDDKPFIGPYRSQDEAQAAVIESLNEGQLALYFTKLRNAEIASINAAIKAHAESLVPFRVEAEKPKPLTANDVQDHKPVFKSFKPWDDDNGAMAKAKFIAAQIAIDTPQLNHRHVAVLNDAGDEIFQAPIRSKPPV